jgi:nicotinamide mononucleotide adenylyltransferase
MSVRYLLPNPVVDYIESNGLYLDDGPNSNASGPTYSTTSASSGATETSTNGIVTTLAS